MHLGVEEASLIGPSVAARVIRRREERRAEQSCVPRDVDVCVRARQLLWRAERESLRQEGNLHARCGSDKLSDPASGTRSWSDCAAARIPHGRERAGLSEVIRRGREKCRRSGPRAPILDVASGVGAGAVGRLRQAVASSPRPSRRPGVAQGFSPSPTHPRRGDQKSP